MKVQRGHDSEPGHGRIRGGGGKRRWKGREIWKARSQEAWKRAREPKMAGVHRGGHLGEAPGLKREGVGYAHQKDPVIVRD